MALMQTDRGLSHQTLGGPHSSSDVLVFPSPLCAKDSILPQTSGEVILHIANLSLLFDFLFCVFGEIILCKYALLQLTVGSNTPRSYKQWLLIS